MTDDLEYRFDYDGENFTIALNDGSLVGCQWLPTSGPIRFVLIFFHGLGAFLSINRTYFPRLTSAGGVVFGTDHFGHGRSDGERGLNSTELLQMEIDLLIRRANILFPESPVFLYGHSMGGLAALYYVMKDSSSWRAFDGIIIECPWVSNRDETELSLSLRILGKFGRFLFPTTPIQAGPEGFEGTQYPQEWINGYVKCDLGHAYITPRLFASSFEMRKVVWDFKRWPAELPMLFMQGGKDGSVGVPKNMEWVDTLREKHPNTIEVVWHRNAEHAMLRNECSGTVLNEVIDFIQRRIGF
jgi:alpha-beta hydrolase superfamily lysophospholipase